MKGNITRVKRLQNRNEIKREIRIRWLTAFLSLAFLLGAYKCNSQVQRYNRAGVRVIAAPIAMKFNLMHNDTSYVSIFADSLDSKYEVVIAASYPYDMDIESCTIEIGLQYGGNKTFVPTEIDLCSNTVFFILKDEEIEFLKSSPFDFISFNDSYSKKPCLTVKTKRYFMRFLFEYNR